jgi:serine/threonine-protein kinase RsbW
MSEFSTQRKISFSSKNENLMKVERLVEDVCGEESVDQDFYGNMLIAVTEAVNNAIQHGNKGNENKNVDVIYERKEKKITFRVIDEGEGFDFSNIPDPTTPENIEKESGRGVFLMRNLADSVEFMEDGRIVELQFDLGHKQYA